MLIWKTIEFINHKCKKKKLIKYGNDKNWIWYTRKWCKRIIIYQKMIKTEFDRPEKDKNWIW